MNSTEGKDSPPIRYSRSYITDGWNCDIPVRRIPVFHRGTAEIITGLPAGSSGVSGTHRGFFPPLPARERAGVEGQASNVIVIQNSEKRGGGTISFLDFAKVGVPLTIVNTAVYRPYFELFV